MGRKEPCMLGVGDSAGEAAGSLSWPFACPVPMEARNGHWIPWNWCYKQWFVAVCVLWVEPGSQEAEPALLTAEPSLSHLFSLSFETVSHVAQAGLESRIQPRPFLTSISSLWSTGVLHRTQFLLT